MHCPDEIAAVIGDGIRRARTLCGITQDELAAALGISLDDVQDYEHGRRRPRPEVLVRIAHALGVPIGFMFGVD
jgi:transcriptional regulator with XRE-family HTH domain